MKKNDRSADGKRLPSPAIVVDPLLESDPAYPIVATVLRVVPASRWAFARVLPDGDLGHLLGAGGNAGELDRLRREISRQRDEVKTGPRIAAALGPLDDVETGVTLLFADARATFGILTLVRTAELGPFTSSEISMLTFALSACSERLSALRLDPRDVDADGSAPPRAQNELADAAEEPAFYVLDRDLEIVLAWSSEDQHRVALTGLRTRIADRLPLVLEETVRELTAAWGEDAASQTPRRARPVPFLVVRTQPMTGPAGLFIGVRIDRYRTPNSLAGAEARFHISPRELQVLALLLDGAQLGEVGAHLHIASSTVQDHVRSLVDKTGTRNRSELIARVLGWEGRPESRPGA